MLQRRLSFFAAGIFSPIRNHFCKMATSVSHVGSFIHRPFRFFSVQPPSSRLKTSFSCPKVYRDTFSRSVAQMTISVGQPVHEGERLENITRLINNSFAGCKVLVDDSIQWYTNAIANPYKSKTILINEAIEAGDAYLSRNNPTFQSLFTIPYEIIRWRDWVNTLAWQRAIESMHHVYHDMPEFRLAIDNCVQTFLQRYEKNQVLINYDRLRAVDLCTHYLLEECGVMKDLWVPLGCHYEVYPGGRNEAMKATYDLFIAPHFPQLLQSVAIRFNRRHRENLNQAMDANHEIEHSKSCAKRYL